jgi:type I restriction enzyme S subunit
MADEWPSYTVTALQRDRVLLVEDGNHGEYRPRPDEFVDCGVAFIRAADMDSGRVLFDRAEKINERARARITKGIGAPGDVLLSHKGTVGKVALVPMNAPSFVCSPQTTFWRTLDERRLDRKYLYAFLRSQLFQAQLATRAGETDMAPYVSLTSQRGLSVVLPPITEQRTIAHILGTLDDKIELNRRMNETLEAIARAIFKSWFVDFDPVSAKASGEPPESICCRLGLTPDLLALFPDRLVDSELGEIPEGWEVGSVDGEFELTMGQSPPGDTYNETGDGLPFYQGRTDFGFRFPARRVYCTAPTRLAKAGDTLVSVRAPVGDINLATEDCAIGRGVAAVRHKTGSRSYSYQFMRSIEDVFARFEAEGTVFGSIGKKDFHAIACVKPPRQLVLAYEACISSLDDRVEVNERESRTLAGLRDTLLPKLISGEIRVPIEDVA